MARLEFWSVRQLWPALKWNPKRPVLTPKNRVWLPAREVRKMIRELPFRSLALSGITAVQRAANGQNSCYIP